jgi:lipid-binding SYLF domain-containing protein
MRLAAVVGVGFLVIAGFGCGTDETEDVVVVDQETVIATDEDLVIVEEEEVVAEEAAPSAPADQPEWKNMKQEAKAAKIDETADEALQKLFAEHPKARDLADSAYGWAVFDNLKLAFGISGGGGNGVAVNRNTGERTYMKMGTGGVGIGLGVNKYQVVFLMEDSTTFNNFIEKGWQADAGATAAAGRAAADAKTDFVNGLAIYQLTEKGLMLNADVAGTKYWKDKKLNP